MKLEDKKAGLIKEIMKRKEHYDGIMLQDLYQLIKNHPQFEDAFGTSITNNKKQYQHSTRALLQYRAPGMKRFKGPEKDFLNIEHGKWTYYANSNFTDVIDVRDEIEKKIKIIKNDINTTKEEKQAIVKVRVNQTKFRTNLLKEMANTSKGDPIKGVLQEDLLIASHIIDYSDCENPWEQGDYNNGLILTPNIDKLFDKKYITFDHEDGSIIYKDIHEEELLKMDVDLNISLPKIFINKERKLYLAKRNKIYGF